MLVRTAHCYYCTYLRRHVRSLSLLLLSDWFRLIGHWQKTARGCWLAGREGEGTEGKEGAWIFMVRARDCLEIIESVKLRK